MSGVITAGNAIHVINLLTAIRHEIFNQLYNKKDGKVSDNTLVHIDQIREYFSTKYPKDEEVV